jgi:hypothetical protein
MGTMNRTRWTLALLAIALLAPATASAAMKLDGWAGHLSFGYAKLAITDAPGGSISLATGVDYAVARSLRVGLDVGYDLLGSNTVQRGSQFASVDYSDLGATLFLHWLPPRGPVRRVSIGPTLVSAHADLSVTAGGASFSDLAVQQSGGGLAAAITLAPSKPVPVRAGLELGARHAFLNGRDDWTLLTARVAVHY